MMVLKLMQMIVAMIVIAAADDDGDTAVDDKEKDNVAADDDYEEEDNGIDDDIKTDRWRNGRKDEYISPNSIHALELQFCQHFINRNPGGWMNNTLPHMLKIYLQLISMQ